MRKVSLLFATAFAILSVSCTKESEIQNEQKDVNNCKEVLLTINASGETTKTYIDGTSVKWASTGEFLEVYQDKNTGTISHKTSSEGTTSNAGETMSFAVGFDATTGTSFDYYAVYPAAKVQDASNSLIQKVNTPATQTPTATSFDPTADLLIAKKVSNGSSQATSLNMQFSRAVAVGKMTITNLASSDPVKKVIFSAVDNSVAVKLAGRTEFDLETAKPKSSYANNVAETSIILDYSGQSVTANTSMDAFFTCYPFALTAGDSFTVQVQTASKTYTRTVTLAGAQKLTFLPGSASRFSVDMSTASATDNAIDLRYACLTGAEYNAAGGTNAYGNVTVNKPHGDKWVTYAQYTSSSIGIRNNASTNDSYVKLPDLVENIKTVVVTFASASTDNTKKITLETTATGKTGDIMSKKFGDMDANNIVTFDLTSLGSTYKTAYLRSNGAQAVVSKIEVYAGDDNRAVKISATESVSAELNNDSPSETNKIDVSWTAVENAAGYEVTLTPTVGEPVVQNVAANVVTTSFTGLAYTTSYTASVVTIADPYLFKANSDSKPADAAVVTGEQPATHVSDITKAGSYTISGLTVMAVSSNNVIAADNTGAILIYKSGHGLAVNDVFNISGSVQQYHGVWEYYTSLTITKTGTTTASYPEPVSYNAARITSYASSPVIEYATATGLANKEARTVTVADGKVLNVFGNLTSVDGKQAIVTGYAFGFNSSKVDFMLVGTPTVDPSIPSLTTDPTNGSTLTWENSEYGKSNAKNIIITLNGSATGYTVTHSEGTTSDWNIADNGSGTLTYSPKEANSSTTTDKTLTVTITHKDKGELTSVITLKQKKQSSFTPFNVWEDSFNSCTSSSTALSSLTGSTTGFSSSYSSISTVYPMSGAIRVGKASGAGTITTPVLTSIEGKSASLTITFKAAGWNGKNARLTLSVNQGNVTEGQTTITSESTMSGSDPSMTGTSYTFHVTGADNTTAITFTTTNSIGIDDLVITQTAN